MQARDWGLGNKKTTKKNCLQSTDNSPLIANIHLWGVGWGAIVFFVFHSSDKGSLSVQHMYITLSECREGTKASEACAHVAN